MAAPPHVREWQCAPPTERRTEYKLWVPGRIAGKLNQVRVDLVVHGESVAGSIRTFAARRFFVPIAAHWPQKSSSSTDGSMQSRFCLLSQVPSLNTLVDVRAEMRKRHIQTTRLCAPSQFNVFQCTNEYYLFLKAVRTAELLTARVADTFGCTGT